MPDPYRLPAEMPVVRGPRWGVTRWRRLVVQALRWHDGEVWTLARQQRRLIAQIERMRFDVERDREKMNMLYESLGVVATLVADKETR